MLSAGARFLSDQSVAGEQLLWNMANVDVWCARAVAGGMTDSTMTRYRAWLRRIARVAQGLPGRKQQRAQSSSTRERVSDTDLELLIESAGGSQWLWWVVVTFGAGVLGSEAASAVVHDSHVVIGDTCRPIVGPFAGLKLESECPGSNWLGFRRWCDRNGCNVTLGDVADTYTDLVVLSDVAAVTTVKLFGHNRLRKAIKRCLGGDIDDQSLIEALRSSGG